MLLKDKIAVVTGAAQGIGYAIAKMYIEAMNSGGGYVFAPGHNIQALVPPENIEAMLDAAMEFR
jgi:uroporphyrinogen-III decarboxylase